jgi:phage regulator Rha-like protein
MNLTIIQQKIFEIRGQKVILDRDLAALYGVETRTLNQAVRRNISIFPEDFMFILTQTELENLRSQFVISSSGHGGTRYKPMAFTEHGVTMLATVLKSHQARKMSVAIVRAFIALKRFVIENGDIIDQLKELKQRIEEHDIQLSQIYDTIENLLDSKSEEKKWEDRERIGFKK